MLFIYILYGKQGGVILKITYVRLENVAGIKVGLGQDCLEIDFKNSYNKIVSIAGRNGSSKSVLLSSLTPFATISSTIDDRGSLPYIISGKSGYKEIHYTDKDDVYIIKHYFKPTKQDGHTVKSYFSMNGGKELNENGNVSSFLMLIENHFGLTPDMIRLMRLGTNMTSFISLNPASRKEYIGKLIEEIELYLKIYKKINEDIRVVKVLLSSNNTNLSNCHISDVVVEEERLKKINKHVKGYEKERDAIVGKINAIDTLIRENNINDLRMKAKEAEASLIEFDKSEKMILNGSLQNVTIDTLINRRTKLVDRRIDIQSRINSYRMSTDTTRKNIERLETSIKQITSNNDIQSLLSVIATLKESVNSVSDLVTGLRPLCTSDDVYQILTKLSSFNQISSMIYTLGNKPLNIYLQLKRSSKSVDKFLKDQMKRSLSRISEDDIRKLIQQVFQDDGIITPNCDTQFHECPYYRLSTTISEIKNKLEEDSYDDETLRYIQVISNNIDKMLNDIDRLSHIKIPGACLDIMREISILDRLGSKLPFFDLTGIQEYLALVREYEVYVSNVEKLKQYEHQLSVYKSSGIDSHLNEIKQLHENIAFYTNNVSTLMKEMESISSELSTLDEQIGLVTRYNDGKKYRGIVESTLEATNKILIPLETSSNERIELTYQLNSINRTIQSTREESKQLENKIEEFNRLIKENEFLNTRFKDLSIIQEAVSTKKGIPVLYMKTYLGKIQKLANDLLRLIYNDELYLSRFKVTQDAFEIPYIKNGTIIPDVKYASQSEVAMITMALSFALAHNASGRYNILLLDEIDSGLDSVNQTAFFSMLNSQMDKLKAEQCFIISHQLNNMTLNTPIDVIKLSDIDIQFPQNIIYE
jgi:energy-coupling factor transporter ATP-binding protein EcfA2